VKNEYNANSYEVNNYINYLNNNIIILQNKNYNYAEKDEYKNIDDQKNDYNNNSLNNKENDYLCINNIDDTQSLGDYTRIKLISNEQKDLVSNILLLHDGRYAISIGKNVDIVDSNNYNIDITLNGHQKPIFSMFQINEEKHRLITASSDMSIMLWIFNKTQFQNEGIITGHTNIIFKVIQFNTNYIISSSMNEIKLWKIDFPFTDLHTLPYKEDMYSLCESNNYLFCASERNDLCCYKLLNEKLELVSSFKNIKVKSSNDIININENLIAIGELEKVTLMDTKLLKIYKIISVSSTASVVLSLCYFKENRLLIGMSNCIKEFNIETCEELGSIEMNEDNKIMSINKLNNDRFSSCCLINSFGCIWGKK
jgi:WD40 repeat protein